MDGRDQDGVEVAPGIIAEGDEHLDGGARMSHCQLDGTAVEGPCGTGAANGGAAAGKGALVFFIGFALRRKFQSEVGGDEGEQQGKRQEDELHDDSDLNGCKGNDDCVFLAYFEVTNDLRNTDAWKGTFMEVKQGRTVNRPWAFTWEPRGRKLAQSCSLGLTEYGEAGA